MKSANGVLILVLGIISWVGFGCLTGIPAWIMGHSALKEIDSGQADPSERQLVLIGKILGMVNTILTLFLGCLWLALIFGLLGFMGFAASNSAAPR